MPLFDGGPQGFESLEMDIDGTGPDGAASRQGDLGPATRASREPMTRKEARMVLTRSYGASQPVTCRLSIFSTWGVEWSTFSPRHSSTLQMVLTSSSSGTSKIVLPSVPRTDAAMMGSTAFLAPLTRTCSRQPMTALYHQFLHA